MTDCPLCDRPLAFVGDEPTCFDCIIGGKRSELHAALEAEEKASA